MSLKYSRYGRRRVMSKRAEHFSLDHSQIFFLGKNLYKNLIKPSEFKFILTYLIDPDDLNPDDLDLALESEEVGCVKCGITEEDVSCIHQDYQTA